MGSRFNSLSWLFVEEPSGGHYLGSRILRRDRHAAVCHWGGHGKCVCAFIRNQSRAWRSRGPCGGGRIGVEYAGGGHPDGCGAIWRNGGNSLCCRRGNCRLSDHWLSQRLSRSAFGLREIVLDEHTARSAGRAGESASFVWLAEMVEAAALAIRRSEEHTSELQSLMRISYAVFCLKKKNNKKNTQTSTH